MKNVTSSIKQVIESKKAAFVERRELLIKSISDLNNSLAPTEDRNGRLHSPCISYQFEDMHGNIGTYGAGEYLPVNVDSEDEFFQNGKKSYAYKSRIKLSDPQLSEVVNLKQNYFLAKSGKVWLDNNINTAYVYIECFNKSFFETLKTILNEVSNEQKDALKSLKGGAPSGKVKVLCEVLSIKEVLAHDTFIRGNMLINHYTYKMLCRLENGATIYGSIPKSILNSVEKGSTVEFNANFEQSKDDNTHAFYKRPSKAIIIKP